MTKKITKILIANRGEIACRVMKTARKMGIATVAVYSDADRKALHVRMADEAVHIGPSPAIESYLVIEKIIDAAKETGADAIHPGYGFLSENPDFVRACEKAKITFIGPKAESMEAMGLKDAAKKLMDAAGVPITPGYHGKDQDPKLLKAKAGMIDYPVLIKAVAGGGGKGMRKVEAEADFDAMLASCQREAKSSFNNDDVLIEKYIQSPRHIEVQVFGDTHGNVVHMFERDCSLQRRHQKVIEEAPAPGMTDAVRKAMTDAAIEAAKAVNYVGAGTVEFIVDGSGKLKKDGFWFMEMNTRLQVEHPVTEMITGLDLVELQIRVAQGEKLPKQKDIKMEGHAVEARLYAEDPNRNFIPTAGNIIYLDDDAAIFDDGGIRIDTGYDHRMEVSVFYDPMILKVIGYGETRQDAIDHADIGINNVEVYPVITNASFLLNCLNHKQFENGNISTSFIEQYSNQLIPFPIRDCDEIFALAAIKLDRAAEKRGTTPFGEIEGWRLNLNPQNIWQFQKEDQIITVNIIRQERYSAKISINGQEPISINLDFDQKITSTQQAVRNFANWDFKVKNDFISMHNNGVFAQVQRYNPSSDLLSASGNALTAPMPGKIIAVNAKAGDIVKTGDPLIIMEAVSYTHLTLPTKRIV